MSFRIGDLVIYNDPHEPNPPERGLVIAHTPETIMVKWDQGDRQLYGTTEVVECIEDGCWKHYSVKNGDKDG